MRCYGCGHRLADCRCKARSVIHDGPTLAHLALALLWFVQRGEVDRPEVVR